MLPRTERALAPNILEMLLVNRSGLHLALLPTHVLRTSEVSSPNICGSVDWSITSKVNPIFSRSLILSMKDSSHALGILPHLKVRAVLRSVKKARRGKECERRTSQYDSSTSYFLFSFRKGGLAVITTRSVLGPS